MRGEPPYAFAGGWFRRVQPGHRSRTRVATSPPCCSAGPGTEPFADHGDDPVQRGAVLDLLLVVPGSRIVTVSSIGHRRGTMNFDDFHFQRGYRPSTAYFQSKLANLMFTYELQRRLAAVGAPTIAVAAHPGNARTEFGRELNPLIRVGMSPRLRMLIWWLMQSPQLGALSTVRAAVDPDARGGDYYGPPGRAQFTGYPTRVESTARSHDTQAQRRLWRESERLTGIIYPIGELAHKQTTQS